MKIPRCLILTIFLLSSIPAVAQNTVPLLVDPEWLAQHLSDRDLVVLHSGSKPGYDSGHIRGARQIMDMEVTRSSNGGAYDLQPIEQLRARFEALGVSDNSRIVVYSGGDGEVPSTTRILFTLDYLGLGDRTSLLNGGLAAWKRSGHDVTSAAVVITPGKLSARSPKNVVADIAFIRSIGQKAGHRLVDARAPVYFNGTDASHDANGHIPGAVNIPFSQVITSQQMIDRARAEELFRAAGIKPGETIVAYCHIGQQATAVIFAARVLGHPVMLYDGSMHDWTMVNKEKVVR
jgi:thiosulfate/3-mercaptopyruvate sulfurtransferase